MQCAPFTVAMTKFIQSRKDLRISIEYHFCNTVRELNWDIKDLVCWLRASHVHFILTHVHQGLPHWDCVGVVRELTSRTSQSLRYHFGFPSRDEVDCKIFLQDKEAYIRGWLLSCAFIYSFNYLIIYMYVFQAMGSDSNPTLTVTLPFSKKISIQ